MPNIFLCHRPSDRSVVEQLASELAAAGHRVWYGDWEIQFGDSIPAKIEEGLSRADYLVLCYSSAGDSAWTQAEWQSILARQLDGAPVKILPALISGERVPLLLAGMKFADLMSDWSRGVRDLLRAIR